MSTTIDDKIVAGAKNTNEIKEDPIVVLTERVDSLYAFRDYYFENHPIENAINMKEDLEKEMKETISKFDEYKGYEIDGSRAMYYYLKGKALNIVNRFIPQAEELLSKAVKLEPKFIDAWNELGECYYKKNDVKQAKNCFMGALAHGRNKISLRGLSMVMREEPAENRRQEIKNTRQAAEYAKQAVALDTTDGSSWAMLADAYFALFVTSRDPVFLQLSTSAHNQVEKDVVAYSKSDLLFNKGIVLKYQEKYQLALESFERAKSLDPNWDIHGQKWEELLKYLKDVQNSITSKGRLKTKRLNQMIQSLDTKYMGPYKNGSYTSGNQTVKLVLTPLKDLKEGRNVGQVIFGKVVCWIQTSDPVSFTFCMVDKDSTCLAVTVYNLAKGRGVTVGDSVAIPDPYLTRHKFTYLGNDFDFKSIRVEIPTVLVSNGKKLGRDQLGNRKLTHIKN